MTNESIKGAKRRIFTHHPCLTCSLFFLLMTSDRLAMASQWPNNCDANTWQVISNSLDINLFTAIFTAGRVRKRNISCSLFYYHICMYMHTSEHQEIIAPNLVHFATSPHMHFIQFMVQWHNGFKRLITVGRELRQQHPSDLVSGAGTARQCRPQPRWTTNQSGVVVVTPDQPWSIPIMAWLNNFAPNLFTTKYVKNIHQNEQRHLRTSITHPSRISP